MLQFFKYLFFLSNMAADGFTNLGRFSFKMNQRLMYVGKTVQQIEQYIYDWTNEITNHVLYILQFFLIS